MFSPGTPNIFVPGDSVFMLFKCMCNNISIEKNYLYLPIPIPIPITIPIPIPIPIPTYLPTDLHTW